MLRPYWKTLFLISRDVRIDVKRPAFNPAGQRFRPLDALKSQPCRCVQTAHAVMAIANHFVHIRKRLQACRQRAERHEFRALDPAEIVFPGLPNIHQVQLFSAVEPCFYVGRSDLQIIHLFSLPNGWALFKESADAFPCIMGPHQLCQVYAFHFFELLREVRKVDTTQSLAS